MIGFEPYSSPLFVLSVDTEADNNWDHPDKIELSNLTEISRFQSMCDKYSIIPTYLVTYECATRDESLSLLKPLSNSDCCEIGYHLHCWTTPPYEKEMPAGVDSSWLQAYQYELPDALFIEKAEALFRAIESNFGKPPTSHRAGRWGVDQRTIDWLAAKAFVTDSSVVPHTSFAHSKGVTRGGPSYYGAPIHPYRWPSGTSEIGTSDAYILELPLSVYIPPRTIPKIIIKLLQKKLPGSGYLDRIYRKLIGGEGALRPDPNYSRATLRKIMQSVLNSKLPVLNAMIHSSELSLGCSPFSKTEEEHRMVWTNLEEIFKFSAQNGLQSVGLSKAARLINGKLG